MMVEEGVVAENNNLMQVLARTGFFNPISQANLLALLDYYCDPTYPVLSLMLCQFIVGIEIPAVLSSVALIILTRCVGLFSATSTR